jgi:hypothetical protein
VARIVTHYGSQVVMELDGERYDAGISLDLFLANEKINARKKRRLAEEALRVLAEAGAPAARAPALAGGAGAGEQLAQCRVSVRGVIQSLFASNRLVLYEREVSLEEIQPRTDERLEEFVTRALLELFTVGKIDVTVELAADFAGDRRVLEDIRLLAENGYGEDGFGNNLPLPAKLEYLRK